MKKTITLTLALIGALAILPGCVKDTEKESPKKVAKVETRTKELVEQDLTTDQELS